MGRHGLTGVESFSARIRDGALARAGLLDDAAIRAAAEALTRIDADGIETLRLIVPDQHGLLRGKTIVAEAALSAFTSGVRITSTLFLKDLAHRTVFPVWDGDGAAPMLGASDLLLTPLPGTFQTLPWSESSAWMLCDVATPDGTPLPFSTRTILSRAVDRLAEKDLAAIMGLEVEFNVFELVDPSTEHAATTMPPLPPATRAFNQGYQFLTETRYDAAEALMDKLRRAAQGLGMPVRSVEVEMGPGQFEFTFAPADPLTIADMAVRFRTMVKEVCAREGLFASFMAKPRLENVAANGWHIHQSITDAEGRNLMEDRSDGALSDVAGAWIAGLLRHAAASCVATTPTVNGYKRYTAYQLAPNRVCWGRDNRGAMIRALTAPGDAASRVENRSADSTANPYMALTSQILSGLDGLEKGLTAPEATADPYDADVERLPPSLLAALESFEASAMYREALGDDVVAYFATLKRAEWDRYAATVSDWEQREYFSVF